MTVGTHDDDKAEGPLMMNKKFDGISFTMMKEIHPSNFLLWHTAITGIRAYRL